MSYVGWFNRHRRHMHHRPRPPRRSLRTFGAAFPVVSWLGLPYTTASPRIRHRVARRWVDFNHDGEALA